MKIKMFHHSIIKRPVVLALMLLGMVLNSCQKKDFTLPLNLATVRFDASSYTIERNATAPTTINIPLSLPLEQDGSALLSIDPSSTGLSSQYTVNPAIPASGLKLNFTKGQTSTSFTIASLENFEGDITIVFTLSNAAGGLTISNTNAKTTVTIHGKPIVLPSLTASLSSLDFGNVSATSTSASKSFTVTGVKLTAPVSVVAPANFKISLDNVTFSNSVSITAAAAMAAPVTVYAEFIANTGTNQTVQNVSIALTSGTLATSVSVKGTEVGNAAPGILISQEDFNYGASGGNLTAKAPAWTAYSAGGSLPVQYVSPGLTFSGYAGSGVGGSLSAANNKSSAEDVTANFTAQTSGSVYVAQLLNFASAPTTQDFFASLGDGAAGATPAYYNRIYVKANGSQFNIGVDKNANGIVTYSATNYDYGTTYLVVTRYDFASGASNIYVLSGAIPVIEPATPDAISTSATADPANLSLTRYVIRQSTNLPLAVTVDGIRIATSWKQAVGL